MEAALDLYCGKGNKPERIKVTSVLDIVPFRLEHVLPASTQLSSGWILLAISLSLNNVCFAGSFISGAVH